MRRVGLTLLLSIIVSGCSLHTSVNHVPLKEKDPRHLVVFIDGTSNDEKSRTNISRLHNLVTHQNRRDISTTYIKGVGTGAKVLGKAVGWGMRRDVIEAYLYLAENYDPIYDKISIFGFSRGAYAARILAALLYVAGIDENIKEMKPKKRAGYIKKIYDAYKNGTQEYNAYTYGAYEYNANKKQSKTIAERRIDVAKVMKRGVDSIKPVFVQFMGIWDTVEALGWPDFARNVGEPNTRYADQLCNIEYASHAVSIDDDRARVFTPILLTQQHLIDETCDREKTTPKVEEVWFAGAHSDVGGGYNDTTIGGLSLNWMLGQINSAKLDILPNDSSVYANYLDKTHDPEKGLLGLIYHQENRDIAGITSSEDYVSYDGEFNPPLNVHQSALDRICTKSPEIFESFWFREKKYENCVTCNEGIGSVESTCDQRIRAVNDSYYKNNVISRESKKGNSCDEGACWEANGKDYALTKSCNFDHKGILERATQRVKITRLYSPEDGEKKIIFYADSMDDRTGLYLKRGVKYQVNVEEYDVEDWVDCTNEATYDNGRKIFDSKGCILLKLGSAFVKPFSNSPTTGYMALLGKVAGQQFSIGKLAKNKGTFTPKKDGELILYVNEPRMMFLKDVYKNNHGMLRLTIKPMN